MTWKTALVAVLVVALVLVGLPVLMPGMGAACPDCGPAVIAGACVFAVLAAAALWLLAGSELVVRSRSRRRVLWWAVVLERPPQLA